MAIEVGDVVTLPSGVTVRVTTVVPSPLPTGGVAIDYEMVSTVMDPTVAAALARASAPERAEELGAVAAERQRVGAALDALLEEHPDGKA